MNRFGALIALIITTARKPQGLAAIGFLLTLSIASAGRVGSEERANRFTPELAAHLQDMGPPAISPNGSLVAYTLGCCDISIVDVRGEAIRALPGTGIEVAQLNWTPDSRSVTFIARDTGKVRQVWKQSVEGGDATALTSLASDVSEYALSPDGSRMALVVEGVSRKPKDLYYSRVGDPIDLNLDGADLRSVLLRFAELAQVSLIVDADVRGEVMARFRNMPWDEVFERLLKSHGLGYTMEDRSEGSFVRIARLSTLQAEELEDVSQPHVIKELFFKREGVGYLKDEKPTLRIRETASGVESSLEGIPDDPTDLAWSPDSRLLAFAAIGVSHVGGGEASDIFIVEPGRGTARNLTKSGANEDSPAFISDGRQLVYRVEDHPEDGSVVTHRLDLASTQTGNARPLVTGLDREISGAGVTTDGRHVLFLVADRGTVLLARAAVSDGRVETVVAGERVVESFHLGPRGEAVVLSSTSNSPKGVFLVEGKDVRPLAYNPLVSDLALPGASRLRVTANDGVEVEAFLIRPTLPSGAGPPPAVVWLHGGPYSMHDARFDPLLQVLVGAGYAVIAPNPRGSSSYGRSFGLRIRAWGTTDYEDVMALVDEAARRGLVDAERIGVGGWSYGGWLTNHILTRTTRFKAAASGSSIANFLADYGANDRSRWTEDELGLPWTSTDSYIRVSPLFQVSKVRTPTLVLCGEEDIRTPVGQSEQWYQALRRVGVESELVVYPGEGHSMSRQAYSDSWQRIVAWFKLHLKAERDTAATARLEP